MLGDAVLLEYENEPFTLTKKTSWCLRLKVIAHCSDQKHNKLENEGGNPKVVTISASVGRSG